MISAIRLLAICSTVVAVVAGGCGDDQSADGASITVSAAASLRGAFTEIGEAFTAVGGVAVTVNFDSSATLVTQIIEGAPASVFASADEASMSRLVDDGLLAGDPSVFARNELVIVTKPGNPKGIGSLADLADAGVISLCGADAPCGRYAQEALDAAGVSVSEPNITRGQNATATLTAVTQGDAVAGVVYATDARSAGALVDAVDIPSQFNVVAVYPIGMLAGASNDDGAAAFVDFVLGPLGQAILAAYGFLPPA